LWGRFMAGTSVIVNNFHGIGAAVGPGETEPPLIVDTEAVLSSPIT